MGEREAPDLASPKARAARSRSLRSQVARSSHARFELRPERPDPIALLEEEASQRLPELVPIRYGRMSTSPFSFFRGAASIMASDLAATPVSGIQVQLRGDAHLANFGGFASAERQLLFDLNDFDETLPGPWEWDVKRLAASIATAGRERNFSPKDTETIVEGAVTQYREAIREFAGKGNLAIWYARASAEDLTEVLRRHGTDRQVREVGKTVSKAWRKDHARAFAKLAVTQNGHARIRSDPPLIVRIDELVRDEDAEQLQRAARHIITAYLSSLPGTDASSRGVAAMQTWPGRS